MLAARRALSRTKWPVPPRGPIACAAAAGNGIETTLAAGRRGCNPRFVPAAGVTLARIGAKRIAVSAGGPVEVFPGFTVMSEMAASNTFEEALVVDTPEGSVVIVGCAHPGIVAMLRRVAETTKRPIHMVIGGFHLLQTPADDVRGIIGEFKSLGVAWAGPTHCTGDEALRLFREAYGDRFIPGGVGTVVGVPKAGAAPR